MSNPWFTEFLRGNLSTSCARYKNFSIKYEDSQFSSGSYSFKVMALKKKKINDLILKKVNIFFLKINNFYHSVNVPVVQNFIVVKSIDFTQFSEILINFFLLYY